MTTKLSKIDNYWVVVSDEKPKNGDICLDGDELFSPYEDGDIAVSKEGFNPIIFSQNPEHNLHTITFTDEVIAEWGKELGIVDVDKYLGVRKYFDKEQVFIASYNQCLSDNADNKFTLEDMRKAIEYGHETDCPFLPEYIDKFFQSLNKQEYFCELEMEIKCPFDFTSRCTIDRCNCEKHPKKTNNSVKVIKIWK